MEKYTYIIVGAGSAGCVLAYRLSENPANKVLLIEAGSRDDDPLIRIPMGVGKTLLDPKLNWYFMTEPDPGTANRPRVWIRGKTLGGSSSVNGMIYCRGQPDDYDQWEAAGNVGWGWQSMLASFRSMENHVLGDDGVRGVGGPLDISIQPHRSKLTEAILAAGMALGLERKEDLNRPELEGIGYTPCTISGGRRVSAADAFLKPARQRPNLHIRTETLVHKIIFENQRAVGLQCEGSEGVYDIHTEGEIILSAGAIQSPKILQLSGIGPKETLNALGIKVICDLPGVGANLREHKTITMQHRLRANHSHNCELRGWRLIKNAVRYALTRSGVLASTYDINAFIRTNPQLRLPDAQVTFWSLSFNKQAQGMELEQAPGMMAMGYPLRTQSEGSITIRSADPHQPPQIRTNFLDSEYDRRSIIDLFRYMRELFRQSSLQPLIAEETHPGTKVQSDEEILEACRQDDTCLHAVGTCKMGIDAMAVVNPHLKVHGVTGLRVVDCSIMPTQVSGNTNGPVMAVAWRAADLLIHEAEQVAAEPVRQSSSVKQNAQVD